MMIDPSKFRTTALLPLACALLAVTPPAHAQSPGSLGTLGKADSDRNAFEGDWFAVGMGLTVTPTYDGSNDYDFMPLPLMQGSLGGIGINLRAGGLSLDFIPERKGRLNFSLGPVARIRTNRDRQVKDEVVDSLVRLDTAVELGPSAGISIDRILHKRDVLSFSADVRWDVAGAHRGMTAGPSVTYFTPVNRGAGIALNLDVDYGDGKFMDYYYSVSPENAAASGLTPFAAKGGFYRAGGFVAAGVDFNGNLLDGGFIAFTILGYSRMLNDAAASPFTSERGSPDQFIGSFGLGYTF